LKETRTSQERLESIQHSKNFPVRKKETIHHHEYYFKFISVLTKPAQPSRRGNPTVDTAASEACLPFAPGWKSGPIERSWQLLPITNVEEPEKPYETKREVEMRSHENLCCFAWAALIAAYINL